MILTDTPRLLMIINQCIDISLYSWITLIMFKRVICKLSDRNTFKQLRKNHHYLSDVFLLAAATVAVCQYGNQLYSYLIACKGLTSFFSRTLPWMIFHKLIEISILIKYRNSQPKLFLDIYEEVTAKFKKSYVTSD